MEQLYGELRGNGTNLSSDMSVRRKERPLRKSQSRETGYENFGGSFDVNPKRASQSSGTTSKSRSTANTVEISEDDIDSDELCIGPSSQKSDGGKVHDEDGIVVNGEYHAYHPDYREKQYPKFKKKKKTEDNNTPDAGPSIPIAASRSAPTLGTSLRVRAPSRSPSPPLPRPPPRKEKSSRLASTSGQAADKKSYAASTSSRRPQPKPQAPLRDITSNGCHPVSPPRARSPERDDTDTPRPPRPKPRPAYNAKEPTKETEAKKPVTFPAMSPLSSDKGKGRDIGEEDKIPGAADSPFRSPLAEDKKPKAKAKEKGKGKTKKQPNPIVALSPLSSPVHGHLMPSSSQQVLQTFPSMSPLSSPVVRDETKERRSKAVSSSQTSKKSRRRAIYSSTDDSSSRSEGEGSSRKCAPFPMQTQLFEAIGRSPDASHIYMNDSDEDNEEEARRRRKRMRENPDLILAELMRSDNLSDDDDSFFLDPNVDPATLCPWCDERLPPVPTPHLSAMIAIARRASSADARPTNPLGLRAPLGAFVAVCQRHRFETHQVPLAQQKSWPMEITWELINARVEAQKARLQEIMQDVDERFFPGAARGDDDDDDDEELLGRPRRNSLFWKDVVKSVRKKGSRHTAGIRGQFASFSKTQPGYYGELGYFIIHQTIYNLFPPTSFESDSTLPITPTDFIQLILVPEAAVQLIMDDLDQSRAEAIQTLRESAEYGVAMFPDDHSDATAAVEAGDQLVMERAMARRKELEEEERLEDELLKAHEESEKGKQKKTKSKEKGKARAKGSELKASGGDLKRETQKTTRKTRAQSSADRSEAESDSDIIMISDSANSSSERKKVRSTSTERRPKSRIEAARSAAQSEAEMDIDTDIPPDSSDPQERPRPKPRPRVREPDAHQNKGQADDDNVQESYASLTSDADTLPRAVRNRQGKTRIPAIVEEVIDVDATPRSKKRSLSPSASPNRIEKRTSPILPLDIARERRLRESQRTKKAGSDGADIWSHRMSDPAHSLGSEDELLTSNVPKSRRSTRQSAKLNNNYDWLLNDSSSSQSS